MSGPRRLLDFDDATSGSYFITICVRNMEHRFGEILNASNHLNEAGTMISEIWQSNAERCAGMELDESVVMPNHFHAIIHRGIDPGLTTSDPSLTEIVGRFKSLASAAYTSGVKSRKFPPFDKSL